MAYGEYFLPPFRSKARALTFTLFALLVVVATIAILAAVLLAALSAAKVKAHEVTCLNNVKQLGQAATMYHQNFGNGFHAMPMEKVKK